MTNMAAEIGGFTGIVAPDKKAVEFLVERRGMDRKQVETMIQGLYSDPDAQYAHVIELDASEITPMVATPGDPGNGKYIREFNTPVPVELAYGGTCTAGKNEDMDMYALVLADALKHGKKIADSVEFYIQFGSQETREYAIGKGYLDIFQRAGARVIEPSCGACINAGPGVSTRADQVVISAQNRNFPGRSGPGQMYLASPLTVAASAVAGYIVEYQPSEGWSGRRGCRATLGPDGRGARPHTGSVATLRCTAIAILVRMCGSVLVPHTSGRRKTNDIRDCRTMHRDQRYGMRRCLPGRLHSSQEG
jgi:3-isopropylmalate/(R)-2-methylmalate dehydratase large subunit